jgi:hypothetical protein
MIYRIICSVLFLLASWGTQLFAQPVQIFPLESVKSGLKGYGKTIFSGTEVGRFEFEILGTLENVRPDQNIILARLSGEILDRVGVFAGMSGSPVYIDERLVGAVAYAFSFATEPIAGITPIEEMLDIFKEEVSTSFQLGSGTRKDIREFYQVVSNPSLNHLQFPGLPGDSAVYSGFGQLRPIDTPLNLSGFSEAALEPFYNQLKSRSFVPVFGTGAAATNDWPAASLEPGSTISVQLVRGDMEISASGTVTHVVGNKIYAFGHPFMGMGYTEMPMSTAGVIGVIPNLSNSQKISATLEPIGTMKQDRATGILGIKGQEPRLIPVNLKLQTSRNKSRTLNYEVVADSFLTPYLVTLTVHNTIVASERNIGSQTLQLKSTIFIENQPEVRFQMNVSDMVSGPALTAVMASAPVNFILSSGFEDVVIKKIDLEIAASEKVREAVLEKVWQDKIEVHAGEEVGITVFLRRSDGKTVSEKFPIKIPEGLEPGPLKVMIGDGLSITRVDADSEDTGFIPKNLGQLVKAINNLKRNDRLYVRLYRERKGAIIGGEGLPALPPSILELYNSRKTSGDIRPINQVIYVEHELPSTDFVLSGRKILEVIVKG